MKDYENTYYRLNLNTYLSRNTQHFIENMNKLKSKEFIIGLSVIVALAILFFGINFLKGINLFTPANFYTVSYDNVAGLETAAAVTVDGYKVGQVRDIEFDYENPGKIKVTLALNKNLRVPVDSRALITPSLLSGPSIEIQLGKSKKFLEIGSAIPAGAGTDMMATVTDEIMPKVVDILPTLDSLMVNLNATAQNLNALSGHPALYASVSRLDMITANVAALSSSLKTTMNTQVPGVMGNARSITAHLDSVTADLAVLSAQLKALPLDGTMDNVMATTANLKALSESLNSPDGTLGQLMHNPELYHRLNRVTADIDSLIVDIKAHPKRYISIKLL